MRAIATRLSALMGDTRAATAVEYGLIAALCVVAVIASIMALADQTSSMWKNVHDAVIATH